LPTESDRTPPAGAPQEPGGDGGDGGLRQGDGGALQDGRRWSGHVRGVRDGVLASASRSAAPNAAVQPPATRKPASMIHGSRASGAARPLS